MICQREMAQNHVDPETKESDPIPIVLTVYTAGNQSYYTAAHWITNDWIEEMYRNYSCLQGLFCTENYWVWASGIESRLSYNICEIWWIFHLVRTE